MYIFFNLRHLKHRLYYLKTCTLNRIEQVLFGIAINCPRMTDSQMWLAYHKTCKRFKNNNIYQIDVNYFYVLKQECERIVYNSKKWKTMIRIIGKLSCLYKRSTDRVWSYPDGIGYKTLCKKYLS